MDGLVVFAAGLRELFDSDGVMEGYGYICCDKDGGASHTVLRPTTCAVSIISRGSQTNQRIRTIEIKIWILLIEQGQSVIRNQSKS